MSLTSPAAAMPRRDPNSEKTIDFVVNKGNGIKGLADTGIESVPQIYILPPEERLEPSSISTHRSIPVIDVSNWDDPGVAEAICEAAGKWGFFQIINHGVPFEALDAIKEAAHRFFGLPSEERNKYWAGNSPTETVVLKTSFAPQAETVLEWKDYLNFRCSPRDLESFPLWPSVCRDEVVKYLENAKPVIRKLLEILLKGLKEYALTPMDRQSPFSYNDNGGLYVRATDDNSWIHVPPVNGALVINVGDILQITSNDRYKSIEHRVVANGSKDRVSVPIFVIPGADAVVGPMPEVLQSGEQPLYKEVVFSDYLKHFFSSKHDGKKTLDFARI
ncbi:hypothetical protein V6N13_039312 [Hibiscus sabdariffa]